MVFPQLFLLLAVSANEPPGATTLDVPVVIREDAGVPRRGEPVTCGVPIPRSASVRDPATLHLVTSDGKSTIPAQFRVLARWDAPAADPRASIAWVTVDFDATLAASARAEFRVHTVTGTQAPEARRIPMVPTGIAIEDGATSLVVDTGAARFVVPRNHLALLEQVELPGNKPDDPIRSALRSPAELVVMPDGDGAPIRSSANPGTVEVIDQGPMRATVRIRGRMPAGDAAPAYKGALDYIEIDARLRFQAGSARVRADVAIRNPDKNVTGDAHNGGKEVAHRFRDASVRVPLALAGDSVVSCPDVKGQTKLAAGDRFVLFQASSGGRAAGAAKDNCPEYASPFDGFQVRLDGAPAARPPLAAGKRASGAAAIGDSKIAFGVGLRDFWQSFPKSIRLGADGVADVALWPREWPVPHRLRGGVQKSHRIILDFRRAEDGGAPAALASIDAMTRAPLIGAATPEAIRDSEGLGWISVADFEHFRWYETSAKAVIAYDARAGKDVARQGDVFREMEDKDEYGWMHWGDHYREGSKSLRYWGNGELDFGLCVLWQWVRNGDRDRRFFDVGEAAVRHLADVDVYHTDRDIWWANHGVRKHDASGTTDHTRAPNLSHFWTGGLTTYWFLTGDDLARDTLLEIGGWLRAREHDPKGKPGILEYGGEVRSRGWAMQAALDIYRVTGDAAWIEFAGRVSRAMVEGWMSPDGLLPNSQGLVDPWMTGYVTEALGRYLLARRARGESDPGAERTMQRLLDTIASRAWLKNAGAVAYVLDPKGVKPPGLSSNLSATQCDGFAYGFELFGKAAYLRMAKACFDSGRGLQRYPYYYSTTLSTPAKNAGFKLRFGQAWMHLAERLYADHVPPRVTAVAVVPDSVTASSARVRFDTDEPALANAKITGPGAPATHVSRAFTAGTHEIEISSLQPDASYSMVIEVTDPSKNKSKPITLDVRTHP
ncbi:MAG: hypothetical protein HYR85_13455 [Planctomycetes bacterium]|nr:hypothetical protein [Planctomycetota bacterium]